MDKKEHYIYVIIAGVIFDKREENPQKFIYFINGVLSFIHSIEGQLNVNGKEIDFSEGRAYFEKDWEAVFPKILDLDAN
ncbi:MAG: hypothetical protein ACFFCZ_12680 [Promethearchaeota archaeon]